MIELRNINKRYGDLQVLKDISLQVNDGEIFGIIGPSGAGKSTLLRCVNGLETYQSGEILINGEKVDANNTAALRVLQRSMGMIFQNFNLLSRLNVEENVGLPLQFWGQSPRTPENRKRIAELLALVGLSDKAKARPSQLSGGQKQRVAIARALVLNPKILLCDEATSALDPKITKEILALLADINARMGITILIVTHQMEVVKQVCERVAFLNHGHMVAVGTPEDLFVQPQSEMKDFLGESFTALPCEGVNIQLFFKEHSGEPVITEMARELNIDFSICWGKLEDFRAGVLGSLVINVKPEQQEMVKKYLSAHQVQWEVL